MKTVTYLINLDSSKERLNKATEQLNAVDWPFERISAYDGRGKQLSDFEDYDDNAARKQLGRRLLNSEIGCYLSHYKCAEQFLQTDADYLVVLEDDLKITSEFKKIIDATLAYLHEHPELDWYLVNLASKKKKLAHDITMLEGHSLWHAFYFPIRGLGLIWSRQGAAEFVAKGKSIYMPVDIFFQNWLSTNGKGLGVWPAPVRPLGIDSDILGSVTEQNIERKDREKRDASYNFKKQMRMLKNKSTAMKHLASAKAKSQ
ncbi:glycosyltransferase family 25 protein [Psychrobacter sanguinis]|uniref:Glycosyl transferase n=1 Tax=Psychrobacter sanguinis TaxID=861445 RepID=A0A844LZG2_9GAMM|nr:glycosyltransferase family 25 protein [Psychrobacter sanguinis]MUG31810.1 glycosyl transferase [Psychrobacter sanguinis]